MSEKTRTLLLLRAELNRRDLLRGGALTMVSVALPSLVGCGGSTGGTTGSSGSTGVGTTGFSAGNTTGNSTTGSTTGHASSTGGSSGGTTGGSIGGTTNSTTGSSSSSSSSSSSASSSSSSSGGTTGSSCTTDSNTFMVAASSIPVGGGTVFADSRYSDQYCGQNGFVIVQPTAGQFVALSSSCTHQCCSVVVKASRSELYCPCHRATFDFNGNVTGGPTNTPLATLPVCTDGTNVYVQLA